MRCGRVRLHRVSVITKPCKGGQNAFEELSLRDPECCVPMEAGAVNKPNHRVPCHQTQRLLGREEKYFFVLCLPV